MVGLTLGLVDGRTLGSLVGLLDGLILGFLVGDSDGSSVGVSVGMFVGISLGSEEGVIVGSVVGADDGVTDGATLGTKLDDDIILFVSFECSDDRLSWVSSLDKSFAIYDESNIRFKFIRVIESRNDKKSYHSIHSPDDVSIDRRLGCWIIANDNDNNNKIDERNNIVAEDVA